MKGHMKAECYKREKTEYTFCKQKGHFEKACNTKELRGGKHASLTTSLKSRESSKATAKDLSVDSGSTDHIIVNKNWFKRQK